MVPPSSSEVSRRHLLRWTLTGAGALVVGAVAGGELVDHGVLPGKQYLDQLDGACSLPAPALYDGELGVTLSGRFMSVARGREVGYSLAYPAGFVPGTTAGDDLALIVMLHGYGGSHLDAFVSMTPAQAATQVYGDVAAVAPVRRYADAAVVTVDGGGGYWNPHPGDDPMAMVIDELIPMMRARGLGRPARGIAVMGISMGGYGALAMAEHYPSMFRAAAAISPAVWTTYEQARAANAGAFASAATFDAYDVITHARSLGHVAVRVASGIDDPFHPGVVELIKSLPAGAETYIGSGCHTTPFFLSQEPAALAFVSRHLN